MDFIQCGVECQLPLSTAGSVSLCENKKWDIMGAKLSRVFARILTYRHAVDALMTIRYLLTENSIVREGIDGEH